MSDGYNGWTNYPTWSVTLWLNDDQDTQKDSHNVVLRAYQRALAYARTTEYMQALPDEDHAAYARSVTADTFKQYVEDQYLNDQRGCLGSDLQSWALGQVNWREIVTTWLEDDLKDNEDQDEDEEDDDDV